jgi:undecaprenyl-diphosphatase
MTLLQSILLGIVQGLTEFLPISSSAHLVLVPHLLGWEIPPQEAFIFDVLVQVASIVAVILFFRHELVKIARSMLMGIKQRKPFLDSDAKLGWLILLATIPAGVIGLAIKDLVEMSFASPRVTAFFLLVTAGILTLAEALSRRTRELQSINWKDALLIGLAQAAAIFPGISRSGSTIAGGMGRGFERPPAARFAFLMSIPIMLAAGLAASLDFADIPGYTSALPIFIPGFLASAVVSYLSIRWLLSYLARSSLYIFAAYCAGLGLLVLALSL